MNFRGKAGTFLFGKNDNRNGLSLQLAKFCAFY